jgi:hypothetical protein
MSSPGSRAATCRGRPCGACQRARRVRSVSSPAVCTARCSSTVSRCRRVASPARRRARCTVLGATCGRAAMLLPGLLSSQRWLPVSVSVELSAGHLTLQFKNIYSSVACRALQQEQLLYPHSAAVGASAASRGSSSPTTTGHVLLGGDVGPGQRNGRSRVEGLVNARICRSVSPRVSRVSLASLVFRTPGTD